MALGWKKGGFTPAKKAACLEALARGVTVAEACREARISPTTFYRHEKKNMEFSSLCRAARARSGGTVSLETLAWERGVTGVEEPVVQGGKVVATRLRRSDAVFRMRLEGAESERFGIPLKALRARIERALRPKIEAEVRAQIAAEQSASRRDSKAIFDELAERLAQIEGEKAAKGAETRAKAAGGERLAAQAGGDPEAGE
jgi:AcrR family transcriptional regulator